MASDKSKMDIKFTRGFEFRLKVDSADSKLVLKNDDNKFIFDNVVDGTLILAASDTEKVPFGKYDFQLLDNNGIVSSGKCEVEQNLLLDDAVKYKSHARLMLEAIEATIEGRATAAQQAVTIDGKSITYISLPDLLRLRQYFADKVAEEEGKTTKSGQKTIIYHWRVF